MVGYLLAKSSTVLKWRIMVWLAICWQRVNRPAEVERRPQVEDYGVVGYLLAKGVLASC